MTWTLLIASLVGIAVLGSLLAYVEDHWKAYRYRGRHRGKYKPPAMGPRVRLWDKDMVYIGDIGEWHGEFYGVLDDVTLAQQRYLSEQSKMIKQASEGPRW
jgi:hypothetical protein